MATVNYVVELYESIANLTDPRTKSLPLVQPCHVLLIAALYLTFILKWGPRLMKNREPFKIDNVVMVYNALQVVGCAGLVYLAGKVWIYDYKWFCQPVDRSDSEDAWFIIKLTYYYYLLKVADLFDTVFFVLRKKDSHISFLHVYHHAGMILLVGGAVNFAPGGHGGSVGILNCFVHCIMYSYYFLTIYKPEYKKNIWWKKYVTQLQIVQFFIFIVHIGSVLFISDCDYPKFAAFVFIPQNVFMLIMFLDFYIKTYVKTKKQTKKNDNEITDESAETKEEKDTVEGIILRRKEDVVLKNGHR